MQSLLTLGQANHDEADAKDHPGKYLRKMPARGTRERDAIAVKIGDLHPKDHLAERRLVGRAFHEGFVEPGSGDGEQEHQSPAEKVHQGKSRMRRPTKRQSPESEHGTEGSEDDAYEDSIDDGSDDTDPESPVANAGLDSRVRRDYGITGARSCYRSACGGGSAGCAAATAKLRAGGIWRATFRAVQSSIHGGQYKGFRRNCKARGQA